MIRQAGDAMSIRRHPVFLATVEAMQSAEELGGCEVEDYGPLMAAIEAEARTRRHVFARTLAEQYGAPAARPRFLMFRFPAGPGVLLVLALALGWCAAWGAFDLGRRFLGVILG